jgi:hypothetical protein
VQQALPEPARLLGMVMVGAVAETAYPSRGSAAQSGQRDLVGLLVLRHLRQSTLRLARPVSFGSHGDIMPDTAIAPHLLCCLCCLPRLGTPTQSSGGGDPAMPPAVPPAPGRETA